MLRFTLLGSGSGGNAVLVATDRAKVLIDCGLTFKQLNLRAQAVGESLDGLRAVFITHEHSDHIKGLGVLARKLGVPLFMTAGTQAGLPPELGGLAAIEVFDAGDCIRIDGMAIESFSISHDAVDPVSYTIEHAGAKLGMASDLGHVSQLVRARLHGSHGLILESNHCPEMLLRGPYPPVLKQRIRGRQGHLSNAEMNSLLSDLLHDRLQIVLLAHVSKENNTPELALGMAAKVLEQHGARLAVARQDAPTPLFEIHA